jgi:cell division protein DivIC
LPKTQYKKVFRLLLAVAVLTVLAISIVPRASSIFALSQQRDLLEQTKTQLQQHHEQLLQNKEDLNSPEMLEKMARERLGMTKEGEQVILHSGR